MELPHLGKQCTKSSCNKLDFLPITCDACNKTFCDEHFTYAAHNCPKAYLKNNQVPVCPLCNIPIPVARGQLPDQVVGAHIDNDCQSDPAKNRRKAFTNRCTLKGCKVKEVIPVICNDCRKNYCLRHRHPQDHACTGKLAGRSNIRDRAFQAATNRQQNGELDMTMSEDEQLARALALSMEETSKQLTQEELDLQLARQLQAMESARGAATGGGSNGQSRRNDRCHLQ